MLCKQNKENESESDEMSTNLVTFVTVLVLWRHLFHPQLVQVYYSVLFNNYVPQKM